MAGEFVADAANSRRIADLHHAAMSTEIRLTKAAWVGLWMPTINNCNSLRCRCRHLYNTTQPCHMHSATHAILTATADRVTTFSVNHSRTGSWPRGMRFKTLKMSRRWVIGRLVLSPLIRGRGERCKLTQQGLGHELFLLSSRVKNINVIAQFQCISCSSEQCVKKNCSLFLERITAANLQTMVAIPGQSVVPGWLPGIWLPIPGQSWAFQNRWSA